MSSEESDQVSSEEEGELERLEEMRRSLLAQLEEEDEGEEEDGDEEEMEKMEEKEDAEEVIGNGRERREEDNEKEGNDEDGGNEQGSSSEEEDGENGWTSDEELLEQELMDIGADHIDNLLEQPIDDGSKDVVKGPRHKSKRFKRILEFRGTDHFNVLPDGWVEITHASGLPIFLHKPTRVCTFARPYFIGRSSLRNHKVPESAIPCLFQKKYQAEMEKAINGEKQQQNDENALVDGVKEGNNNNDMMTQLNGPSVKVKTEADFHKTQLGPNQLYEYAKDRFRFKEICIFKFDKWKEKRDFHKKKRMRRVLLNQHQMEKEKQAAKCNGNSERPGLPSGLKLITVPALEIESKPSKRPFYLNPQGKTSVSILHEFVQKALKCTVRYFFSETRNSTTPYHCEVKLVLNNNNGITLGGRKNGQFQQKPPLLSADIIRQKLDKIHELNRCQPVTPLAANGFGAAGNDAENTAEDPKFITLGKAFGAGKKNAKLLAAKNALDKLVPGIEFDTDMIAALHCGKPKLNQSGSAGTQMPLDASMAGSSSANCNTALLDESAQIFDLIGVTDTRVPELCARAGQPSPYLILQEYLKRYSAFGDTQISLTSRRLRHERHEFQLTIGEHSVKVVGGNKREGKQKAAQAMLKKLHPKNETWGSILRLYGYEAQQKFREARKSKDSVVKLQGIPQDDSKAVGQFQPNALILDKLRAEMLKLSEELIKGEVLGEHQQEESAPPPVKIRRVVDPQPELPILCEEQLRQLSAKLAQERPELQNCLPSVRF